MLYDAIDCVCLAAPDLEAACRPYERLGLRLSPAHEGRRSLHVGGGTNLFTVHFLAEGGIGGPAARPLGRAVAAGRALFAVGLRAPDLALAVRELTGKGVSVVSFRDRGAEAAWLPLHGRAGTDLVLVRHGGTPQERDAGTQVEGLLDHSFPLKRLDHLAVVTHDLEAKTAFWSDVLGVPVAGEVVTIASLPFLTKPNRSWRDFASDFALKPATTATVRWQASLSGGATASSRGRSEQTMGRGTSHNGRARRRQPWGPHLPPSSPTKSTRPTCPCGSLPRAPPVTSWSGTISPSTATSPRRSAGTSSRRRTLPRR
jgi:catechol 2,3-dioxygenase-like lactoylglutathione lyase family enzyme